MSDVRRAIVALVAVIAVAGALPGVAVAQEPAGSQYVEQVPGFAGESDTTGSPRPEAPPEPAPQRESAGSAPRATAPEPTYTAPAIQQAAPEPGKPRAKPRRRQAPLGAHDTPPGRSSTPAVDLGSSSGGNDPLPWLVALLGAMTVAIPATAIYARRHAGG